MRAKPLLVALAPFLILLAVPTPSPAQTRFGVRAGVYATDTDPFVGVEALTPLREGWSFNPNLEWAFGSRRDIVTANGDFHLDVGLSPDRYLWFGGGPALVIHSYHGGHRDNTSNLGFNLLAGAGMRTMSGLIPYVQAKVLVSSDSQAVVAVGVRF